MACTISANWGHYRCPRPAGPLSKKPHSDDSAAGRASLVHSGPHFASGKMGLARRAARMWTPEAEVLWWMLAQELKPHPPTGRRLDHQRVPLCQCWCRRIPRCVCGAASSSSSTPTILRTTPLTLRTSILTVTTSALLAPPLRTRRTLCFCPTASRLSFVALVRGGFQSQDTRVARIFFVVDTRRNASGDSLTFLGRDQEWLAVSSSLVVTCSFVSFKSFDRRLAFQSTSRLSRPPRPNHCTLYPQ